MTWVRLMPFALQYPSMTDASLAGTSKLISVVFSVAMSLNPWNQVCDVLPRWLAVLLAAKGGDAALSLFDDQNLEFSEFTAASAQCFDLIVVIVHELQALHRADLEHIGSVEGLVAVCCCLGHGADIGAGCLGQRFDLHLNALPCCNKRGVCLDVWITAPRLSGVATLNHSSFGGFDELSFEGCTSFIVGDGLNQMEKLPYCFNSRVSSYTIADFPQRSERHPRYSGKLLRLCVADKRKTASNLCSSWYVLFHTRQCTVNGIEFQPKSVFKIGTVFGC